MDTAPVQNAIKLIVFQVQELNFKVNPNSVPENIPTAPGKLNVEIKYGPGFNESRDKNYSISFEAKLNDPVRFLEIFVKCTGIFETREPITDEFKQSQMVMINSPAIVFPFLRSFIATLTTNAGMNPIILPAFNFTKASPEHKETNSNNPQV